jgi:hypothetical protein
MSHSSNLLHLALSLGGHLLDLIKARVYVLFHHLKQGRAAHVEDVDGTLSCFSHGKNKL